MMNGKISKLYREILLELRRTLDRAEAVYLELSRLVVEGMTEEAFCAPRKERLLALNAEYRRILDLVLEDAAKVYPGSIRVFALPPGAGFIERMDVLNAQFEELERIVDSLLAKAGIAPGERHGKEAGLKSGENKRQNIQTWRSMMKNVDFKAEFEKKFDEAASFGKRPNILVAGYTGCGKTTLIRTILGDDVVPASGIDNSKPCRIDFDRYENESIRLWDSRGMELGELENDFREAMREFVSDCQDDRDVDEHIHLVWYLIQGNEARVTCSDLALIREIFTFDDVIVVISKKDITKPEQLKAIRKILTEAGVPEERIVEVSDAESGAAGCRELVSLSCRMLPAAYRDAFMAAQSIDREAKAERVAEKSTRAKKIISDGIAASRKTMETPVPLAGAQILAPVLAGMLAKLASLYHLREPGIRRKAAEFAEELLGAFVEKQAIEKGFTEISQDFSEGLTGALGHFMRNNFEAYAIARIKGSPLPDPGFNLELFETFYNSYRKGMKMKPNILVCGKTGVGKTSLIQAVTHRGVVPDSAIGNGEATTSGFDVYETEIANFIDSEGMNPGLQTVDDYADFILDELFNRLDSDDTEKIIHNIWYCIDGSGARVQDVDRKLIQTFSDKVLLVVTKSELMRKEQTEEIMKSLLEIIDQDRIVLVSAESRTGLGNLIAKAETISASSMEAAEEEMEAFRERWNDYYQNMCGDWQETVGSEADSYINWAAGRAAAIALVPLPLADIAPLTANEIYMIYRLAKIYGVAVDSTVISMLLGCTSGSIIGKIAASFLPFLKVPIAAGITYAVGQVTKTYFESDMSMSVDELKEKFREEEREAKKHSWKSEQNED